MVLSFLKVTYDKMLNGEKLKASPLLGFSVLHCFLFPSNHSLFLVVPA